MTRVLPSICSGLSSICRISLAVREPCSALWRIFNLLAEYRAISAPEKNASAPKQAIITREASHGSTPNLLLGARESPGCEYP